MIFLEIINCYQVLIYMAYTVTSSEKTRRSAAETETKAMLHLMNFHKNSNDVYYFVVDFFNDITGMDRMSDKLWDIQSKGALKSSPKNVGAELVTLFKNFISDFDFEDYILFLGGVSDTLRKDASKNIFKIDNIKESALVLVKEGLKEECKNKTYIDDSKVTEKSIDDFLEEVSFIVNDKAPYEYIKAIIKLKPGVLVSENTLMAIFNEIRDMQASKKNICNVENTIIQTPNEAISYSRHLTSDEIKLLILNRILNQNPHNRGIPISFLPIYNVVPPEKKKCIIEDAQLSLSHALFDKNNKDNFWLLLENIYNTIMENPNDSVDSIFDKLDKRIKSDCYHFNVLSLKYFIAIIKDGVNEC